MAIPLWKLALVPASFRAAPFKVDTNQRGSGRRALVHEFPHRDLPYTEDLGRKARGFPVVGYVIGPDYTVLRDLLIYALEAEGPGILTLPTMLNIVGGAFMVQPREYTVREDKRSGGMAQFDMNFVEVGEAAFDIAPDTQSGVNSSSDNLGDQTVASSDSELHFGEKGIGSA
jgi:prophage DNA circulation protein